MSNNKIIEIQTKIPFPNVLENDLILFSTEFLDEKFESLKTCPRCQKQIDLNKFEEHLTICKSI